MKNYLIILSLLIICSCGNKTKVVSHTDNATSGEIQISVDETLKQFFSSEVETFEGVYPNATINAVYKPEAGCFDDLLKDSSRIIVVSRKLSEDEINYFNSLQYTPKTVDIAKDAIALISNKDISDLELKPEQIKGILTGKYKVWGDIIPKSSIKNEKILVVFDNNNSSTIRILKDSLTITEAFSSNCYATNSNDSVINYIKKNSNAIGVIGVSWISDNEDPSAQKFLSEVNVVSIYNEKIQKGVKPFQYYIAQNEYPLGRVLYIINREAHTGLGTGFTAFVAGDKGQRIILKAGLVPARAPIRLINLN